MKFVPSSNAKEVSTLRFLADIYADDNHVVRPKSFGSVEGGTVVLMPSLGDHLTEYPMLGAQLHSIVQQLVEGVSFMHKHGVAHLDLKPQNVLVNFDSGRLWIIDLSVSVRVRSVDEMWEGLSGTRGYMAPEVGREKYSPILADRWSCGNLIKVLCNVCGPSKDRDVLLGISKELKNSDPRKRPDLSEVAGRLAKRPNGKSVESN